MAAGPRAWAGRLTGRRQWDLLAARYRAQEWLELRAVDAALTLAAPTATDRLVDLGTGTGLVLRRLADRANRPREVVGFDLSAGMLARVGALPSGWSTVQADARDVPLPDGWADVVTCSYLLHLLAPPARPQVLAEARRLLRPDASARLVTVTVWADERRTGGLFASRSLRLAARARPAAWGGLMPYDPAADMAAAGFGLDRRVVLPGRGYPSVVVKARRGAA